MKPLKIYVAGPYSAETMAGMERNTRAAMDAGLYLFQLGHHPFIPHLTHYLDLRAKELCIAIGWERYMAFDSVWLELCDALLYLGPSRGADLELQQARNLGLIIYTDLEQVPDATGGAGA